MIDVIPVLLSRFRVATEKNSVEKAHVHVLTGNDVGKRRYVNRILVIYSKIQVYFKQHYTFNSLKRVIIIFN